VHRGVRVDRGDFGDRESGVSSFSFRPAQRSNTKPLIGIYSESGCGKTWSSLLLARGFVGPLGRIGMIETESGRGEIYVGVDPVGDYLVCPIREEFSAVNYGSAISAAETAGLDALIIDSASHEWEGVGGVLSQAADNEAAGRKGPLVWQKPKISHQRDFVLRVMQTPIPLVILNMRAKYTMEEKTVNGKKEWTRSQDLSPKQSEDILYEMFCHGWIGKDHAFHVTKYPRVIGGFDQVLRDGEPITLETGRRLAAWASGAPHWGKAHIAAIEAAKTLPELQAAFVAAQAAAKDQKEPTVLAEFVALKDRRKEAISLESKAWTEQYAANEKAGQPPARAGSSATGRQAP
jgi:hypothetical protein